MISNSLSQKKNGAKKNRAELLTEKKITLTNGLIKGD